MAVRALGRLERPELIPDIVPSLRRAAPEVRAEAANAIAQAAEGLRHGRAPGARAPRGPSRARRGDPLEEAIAPLVGRLKIETDAPVRSALCESLGRLPFASAEQLGRAEEELLRSLARDASVDSRLGAALGLDALARTSRAISRPRNGTDGSEPSGVALSDRALAALRAMVVPKLNEAATAARVRRVALDALTSADAADAETIRIAAVDPDAQARRLAVRAARGGELDALRRSVLITGAADESAIVRYEAVSALGAAPTDGGCAISLQTVDDRDPHVALLALDNLGSCGWAAAAVERLDRIVHDISSAGSPRGWHQSAHALVALSLAAPSRAAAVLAQFTGSTLPWLRMYAARAATSLKDLAALRTLASDDDDNVREAAIAGLGKVARHDADAIFVAQLGRTDPQLLRTAALALAGTPRPESAVPALGSALRRLNAEGRETTRDARTAIAETMRGLGAAADLPRPVEARSQGITAEDLRRLQGARARLTIRGVGAFDLALIATEAPASVIRFAQLAERGYYNGLTFHRVVPNFVIQGGSPGANEYAGDATYMRDEVGLWPHVRGAVGVSTRGHDTGDAQIFIDLVDNLRLDHVYTVFAQVLNGMNVVDQILEGDVIDRVEILTAP